MSFRGRLNSSLGIATAACALGVIVAACVGNEPLPVLTVPSDGGPQADGPTNVGPNDGGISVNDANNATPGTGPNPGPPTLSDPRCGTAPAAYLGCDPVAVPYDSSVPPAVQLDACAGSSEERFTNMWLATRGPSATGNPAGALYCRGAFGGRPAMVFERDGFQIPSSTELDPTGPDITVIAVMSYVPNASDPDTAAGGIVFQRNATDYPFRGPQISANFARQSDPQNDLSLESTDLLGVSLRFGLADAGSPMQQGVAAVSSTPLSGRSVVVLHKVADELSLRVNGAIVATANVPAALLAVVGQGNPINIGSGGPSSSNNYFKGKLAELLLYTSNPTNLEALEAALKTKWGIP